MRWNYISASKLDTESVPPLRVSSSLKLKSSGATLESPRIENIAQVSANAAKVAQNHDGRKAILATLLTQNKAGLCFGVEARHRACAPFTCVHFTEN